MKQGLTYQLTERKGAADGHSAAVPLSGAFNYIDILEDVDLFFSRDQFDIYRFGAGYRTIIPPKA
jgi:hypothetical protein